MSVITVRLSNELLKELNSSADAAHLPRAEYIRLAIQQMNKEVLHQEQRRRLQKASLKVREESMKISAEFDGIEYDPET